MGDAIEFEVGEGIARIVLNRPDAGNAFNAELARELAKAALACDLDPSVRAVLLTGRGKMFCAGGDLKAFADFGDEATRRVKKLADDLHKAISIFARMDAPLVVAVNGAAAGAGFSLSITGDIVIAADNAKFTMGYTAVGMSPDGSSTWYLPRLVGLRRAQELALTNRSLSASEALDWGLLTRVVTAAELDEAAMDLCLQLAAGPRGAQAMVKKLLLRSPDNSLEAQMEIEGRAIARAAGEPEGIEGVQAFAARRAPVFR